MGESCHPLSLLVVFPKVLHVPWVVKLPSIQCLEVVGVLPLP